MKWLVLVLVAVGLVGCGEAIPASSALTGADGGAFTEEVAASFPFCDADPGQTGTITATACDPSTSFAIDSGQPIEGGDGGTVQTTVNFYTCSSEFTGPIAHQCIAAYAHDRAGHSLTTRYHYGVFATIGYCVPTCPGPRT